MPQKPIIHFSHICGRFDREAGVVRGVSVITECEAKGHDLKVDSQTLMEIKQAAEDQPGGRLKTKLNHRSGVDAVFGYLSDFRVDGPKLLADLHMLKSHDKFEQTWEQLETLPNALGLSVAFAPGKDQRDPVTNMKLARCSEILSADLVPEPAANPTGLFEAKVDSQTNLNMNDQVTDNGEQGGAVSNEQIMDFLQNQLMPRLDAVEQFQSAIQQELENADAEGGDEAGEGDDGNQAYHSGEAHGDNQDGGTAQNGGVNPYANAGAAPAMAGEFAAMKQAVVELQRKAASEKEEAERVEFESVLEVLSTKLEAVTELAALRENENATLRKTLATGTSPIKHTTYFEKRSDQGQFEALVQSKLAERNTATGKPYTKGEATMLAAKENPVAHREYLSRSGVQLVQL
jgi:hypothetical protein